MSRRQQVSDMIYFSARTTVCSRWTGAWGIIRVSCPKDQIVTFAKPMSVTFVILAHAQDAIFCRCNGLWVLHFCCVGSHLHKDVVTDGYHDSVVHSWPLGSIFRRTRYVCESQIMTHDVSHLTGHHDIHFHRIQTIETPQRQVFHLI